MQACDISAPMESELFKSLVLSEKFKAMFNMWKDKTSEVTICRDRLESIRKWANAIKLEKENDDRLLQFNR